MPVLYLAFHKVLVGVKGEIKCKVEINYEEAETRKKKRNSRNFALFLLPIRCCTLF